MAARPAGRTPDGAPGDAPAEAGRLYVGSVMHQRLQPRRHRLRYRMYSLWLDLDALPALHRQSRWLSVNRFNLFSFHEADHGDGAARGLAGWVRGQLRSAGLPDDGPVHLLAMPRVLGHVFNPLSLYFCHDSAGRLRAVLYQVHNTFGERHGYLVEVTAGPPAAVVPAAAPAATAPARHRPALQQTCTKDFHVSPFLGLALQYRFRLRPPGGPVDDFQLGIDVLEAGQRVLVAHHGAAPRPLNDGTLLRLFLSHPLLTLKVVGGIHWEALRLWLKGVPVHHHPHNLPLPISVLTLPSAPAPERRAHQPAPG